MPATTRAGGADSPLTSRGSSVVASGSPSLMRDPTKRVTRSASSLVGSSSSLSGFPVVAQAPLAPPATPPRSPSRAPEPGLVRMDKLDTPPSWRIDEDAEGSGRRVIVVANPPHSLRLKGKFSWIHVWEHARALHSGVPAGKVRWDHYPSTPDLKAVIKFFQAIMPQGLYEVPAESLFCEIPTKDESLAEMTAMFKKGSVHFSGDLALDQGANQPVFKLSPPCAGMGSSLYRRYGSDRFFRLRLDDKIVRAGATNATKPSQKKLQQSLRDLLQSPLIIMGRQYRAFCLKDGAILYWAESGPGLQSIPLVDFSQLYIDVKLNERMTVPKWIARFELGLTPTTPTVRFARNQVFRTPDLMSDSLMISYDMMVKVVECLRSSGSALAAECLPEGYLPSAIRGSYWIHGKKSETSVDMVWQLDFTTCPGYGGRSGTSEGAFIGARPLSKTGRPRLQFSFTIKSKDGHDFPTDYPCDPTEVRLIDDTPAKGVVMTDGCSLMSFGAMKTINEALARDDPKLGSVPPSAAQGRLGPGKGVWAMAPNEPWGREAHFIEVRDSQWKFNDAQTETFVFELHSIPNGHKDSANLGKQTFEVLAHCGVPSDVFRTLLREHLEQVSSDLFDWSDTTKLLYHIERTTSVLADRTRKATLSSDPSSVKPSALNVPGGADDEERGSSEDLSAFVHDGRLDPSSLAPNTINELVVEMLQAGFDPDGSRGAGSPVLAAKIAWIAEEYVRQNISFRLSSDQSRTALVIADHLGVLEENQIMYQPSQILISDGHATRVVIGDVLVTRPPAVQPCDVQKFEAVFRKEYQYYHDVIIMSSKGSRPACSILSGGDYDGDKLLLITDPKIVSSFDQSRANPSFADPPFQDSDWFAIDTRNIDTPIKPLIDAGDSQSLSNELISGFWTDAKFGQLSKLHTKLAYVEGLAHPETSLVGHLFAKALDGRKQGLTVSEEKWNEMFTRFKGKDPMPEWTAREEGHFGDLQGQVFAKRNAKLGKHVMNELVKEGRHALSKVQKSLREITGHWHATVDQDLAAPWQELWRSAQERNRTTKGGDALFRDCEKILVHVRSFLKEHKEMRLSWMQSKTQETAVANFTNAPGSPTKRTSNKNGKGWKGGSSASKKQDLLDLSKRFWLILDRFESSELTRPGGLSAARSLIASCAHVEPLEPDAFRSPPPADTLLAKLQAAIPADSAAASRPVVPAITEEPSEMAIDEPEEDFFDDSQYQHSQIPFTQLEEAALATVSAGALSRSSSFTTKTPTTEPSPVNDTPHRPKQWSFTEVAKKGNWTFCFDICHRDILNIKADSLWAASLGNRVAEGLRGRTIAPHMLDAMSIDKRCAGIGRARERVRPVSYLTSPANDGNPSLPKRARTY